MEEKVDSGAIMKSGDNLFVVFSFIFMKFY